MKVEFCKHNIDELGEYSPDKHRSISGNGYQMKKRLPKWSLVKRTQDIFFLILIILLAIGIRVGITYNTLGVPNYSGMTVSIGETARNISEGRGYVVDNAYVSSIDKLQQEKGMLIDLQDVPLPDVETFTPYYGIPPAPSVLLAITYKIFGEYRYIYFRLLEAVISSFGCLLIFLLGKELFNRNIGLIASFLYAIYLPLAYLSTWVLHDALLPFFTLLTLYLFVLGVRRKSIKYYILAGLFCGIACYFQTSIILLPIALGFGLLIYNIEKYNLKKNILNTIKTTAIMIVVLGLVLAPWIVRNYNVTNHIMLVRSSLWQGIWEGFGEYNNPIGAVLDDAVTYEQVVKEVGYNIPYGTPEYDAILGEKTIKAIKENPVWWLSVMTRRVPHTIVYWTDLGIVCVSRASNGNILQNVSKVDNYSLFLDSVKSLHLREALRILWKNPYVTFYSGLTLLFTFVPVLLSIIGIWLMRRKWRTIVLISTVLFYYSAVNIIFFVNWKTLIPSALAYIIFSAITIYYIAFKLKVIRS